jgi:hypothetical protein
MEFWEAAVLTIGGLWLVGRMSRSHHQPIATATAATAASMGLSRSAAGTTTSEGNTTSTNLDGSAYLVAGEPLGGPTTQLGVGSGNTTVGVSTSHFSGPVAAPRGVVTKPQPKLPQTRVPVSTPAARGGATTRHYNV